MKRSIKNLTATFITLLLFSLVTSKVFADEWLISAGGGNNLHTKGQTNQSLSLDYSFTKWKRSFRQEMLFGVSLTAIESDTPNDDTLYALSFYPQLNLYAPPHEFGQPFFFVRALGPSYLSENRLGKRKQANHFAFQAQVGAGLYIPIDSQQKLLVAMAFKHFSNANLFSDNDGIDLPIMLNIGLSY